MKLTEEQRALLNELRVCKRYPIARFELRSTKESEWISTALDHVRIEDVHDSMRTVKARAALLREMEEQGLIRVCYRLPVSARSDFQVYYDSDLFEELCAMVAKGCGRPGYLFDTAAVRRGVVTATAKGRAALLEEG